MYVQYKLLISYELAVAEYDKAPTTDEKATAIQSIIHEFFMCACAFRSNYAAMQ